MIINFIRAARVPAQKYSNASGTEYFIFFLPVFLLSYVFFLCYYIIIIIYIFFSYNLYVAPDILSRRPLW